MYVSPKKKKRLVKKQLRDEQFLRTHTDIYVKYRNRGYSHNKAVELARKEVSQTKTKKGTKTLQKLQRQYQISVSRPGVSAISLQGVRRTKAVDNWISNLEAQGEIIDEGYKLKFPKNVELGRY